MPRVDVIIPVLNEEHSLSRCLERLIDFLEGNLRYDWRIVVADNGSTDHTFEVAQRYVERYVDQVEVIYLSQRGRGRALKKAWLQSDAEVVSYMDVDLSTGLDAFPALIGTILAGESDIAWGSRLSSTSRTRRSINREIISRMYNLIIRMIMRIRFKDAQCGFKALSHDAAKVLLPHIKDNNWFFDTELLIVAEKNGFRGREIPVEWTEDSDSRVKIVKTALEDLKGLMRLRFGGIPNVFATD
ncbi:MAG: glycosyl transferase [Chloroflexi bacterium]|nr:glycosyl transferase [Chloroflexota bacterium]|tara:strand:- start:599 stop:1327 length:729 start_codon:yes stop_codon:yes gene_type:complete